MSRLASDRGIPTLACDADPACVERSWREVGARRERHLLPLLLDLTNPSPAQGFAHRERESFAQRRPPRTALALALVHHLAISNNVPLGDLSGYFAGLFDDLVIEFVPKRDPKVELLLATREDVFPHYTREGFEAAFARDFQIEAADAIIDSARVLYRMRRRPA